MTKRKEEWRPRLSIEIDSTRYSNLRKVIPWGTSRILFLKLIDGVLSSLKKEGPAYLGALLSKDTELRIIPVIKKKD